MLALLMVFPLMIPSFAADEQTTKPLPIVTIGGNGGTLADKDGNVAWRINYDVEANLKEQIMNVIFPHFTNAILFGDWEPYYQALEVEFNKIYKDVLLDGNGEPSNGTTIPANFNQIMDNDFSREKYKPNVGYTLSDYRFRYDWRLDPYEIADSLNYRINQCLKATGNDKLNIYVDCIGGTCVLAYLQKYGTEKIQSIIFDTTVANGCNILTDFFCGEIQVDADKIDNLIQDLQDRGKFGDVDEFSQLGLILSLVKSSIQLAEEAGLLKMLSMGVNELYNKVFTEVAPHVLRNMYATWPNYWATIYNDKYEKAKNYIFPTDELKEQYAGLIAKNDNYQKNIASDVVGLIKKCSDEGVIIGSIAKYGYSVMPAIQSASSIGDNMSLVKDTSFGATTAKAETALSNSYIAEKEAAGLGKYISPDKQIDASTALFPDKTWFIKGYDHNEYGAYEPIALYFLNSNGEATVNSNPNYPQYMIAARASGSANSVIPMTEENANSVGNLNVPEIPSNTKLSLIQKAINWIKSLFNLLKHLFTKGNT